MRDARSGDTQGKQTCGERVCCHGGRTVMVSLIQVKEQMGRQGEWKKPERGFKTEEWEVRQDFANH